MNNSKLWYKIVVQIGRIRPHHGWARPGAGPCPLWCGWPLAPLRLIFGLREALIKIGGSAFVSSKFREYFLCSFSETQKQQKTGNWHCGILLIG
jgi:hypothetical protein